MTYPTYISILDLDTNNLTRLNITALDNSHNINSNGGYYFNGTMSFTVAGNKSVPNGAAGVYAINSQIYQAILVLARFNGLEWLTLPLLVISVLFFPSMRCILGDWGRMRLQQPRERREQQILNQHVQNRAHGTK